MLTTTGRKLVLGGLVVGTVTAYMAYLGAADSWQYYLTADECRASGPELVGCRLRVSGTVAENSLDISSDRKSARFSLRAALGDLRVVCSGPLPDNLAENKEVVVEGQLDAQYLLRGNRVLTRCASKYVSQNAPSSDDTRALGFRPP